MKLCPLLGMTGLNPTNAPSSWILQRSAPFLYAVCGFDYNAWFAGGRLSALWDRQYSLNGDRRQIWRFSNVPIPEIPVVAPYILDSYPGIWAIAPIIEQPDAAIVDAVTKAWRKALPNTRMIVGCGYSNFDPEFMEALKANGTLACGSILGAHDANACPGAGGAVLQPWTDYIHPDEQLPAWENYPYFTDKRPNLIGRIKFLQSYSKWLLPDVDPTTPKVMLSEYNLFSLDTFDGYLTAHAAMETNCPICLGTPHGPMDAPDAMPWNNGIYDPATGVGRWSRAMTVFIQTLTQP